jgi:Protein of unknown function (DUF4231)
VSSLSASNHYLHTVRELHQARMENRITEQEFGQRLDEAINEEAKRQEQYAPLLLRETLQDIEKDISEEQTKAFEAKLQQEKNAANQQKQKELNEQRDQKNKERDEQRRKEQQDQEKRAELEREQEAQKEERRSFRLVARDDISERAESARKLQRQYNVLQIILLVFSAVTATMAGIDGIARIWVALTGVIATIAGGILTTFKVQDRIYANHKAAAELRLECQKYDYHIDEYKGANEEEAFIRFSRAVNIIMGEQMLQEVELWNPKRDEGKKAQLDAKEDQQKADDSPNAQTAEAPEDQGSEKLVDEHSKGIEERQDNIPGSSEPISLDGELSA